MIEEIQNYGRKNGPLPLINKNDPLASKFWSIYKNPAMPEIDWGTKGSPLWNAAKAGWERRKVEPGIIPEKDFRMLLGHPLSVEIQFEMIRGESQYIGNVIQREFNSMDEIQYFVERQVPIQEYGRAYVDVVYISAIGNYADAEGVPMNRKQFGTYNPSVGGEWEWNIDDLR